MPGLYDLPTPALLLDLDVLERNLRDMAERARDLGVSLRPHVKTHKCVEIAMGQRELGATGLTVSTLYEGRVFADHGFEDLTWAFPFVPGREAEAARLAERTRLGVVVDCAEALQAAEGTRAPFRVWLKIDCGYGRAGLEPGDPRVRGLASRVADSATLELAGLLSHSGHAYRGRSPSHIARIAEQERDTLVETAARLRDDGLVVPELSVGSTPAMSHARSLSGVTEARPGNYALNDLTQVLLRSCSVADCAATVLSTLVSSRPASGSSVIDAGALSLSLDPGPRHASRASYGRLLDPREEGTLLPGPRLVSLSQEHGILDAPLPVGDKVRVVPNHSCLAVACFDFFHVVRGDTVLDTWKIWRGR